MRSSSCGRWGAGPIGFSAPIFVAMTAFHSAAHAERKARIVTTVTPLCEVPAREIEQRLTGALGETSSRSLDVWVAIERDGVGYRVTLATRDESSALREKVLLAPTCEEAVDAALVVLALATSETRDERTPEPSAPAEPAIPPLRMVDVESASSHTPVTRAPKDERSKPVETSSSSGARSRASLSTGIDVGTLPSPTLVVSGGFARSFSAVEVSALARYGLPSVNETTETGFHESVRRDFGAVEFHACYGVGARVRWGACTGGELGAVRVTRRVEEGGTDVDEDAVSPRLSGVLAAFVRHQGGTVQPELEVSASAVAVGRQESASLIALRVSAGAAVEF
jgi:hypothetical protein